MQMEHMQPVCLQNRHKELREWGNQPRHAEAVEDYCITVGQLLHGGPGYHAESIKEVFVKRGERLRDTLRRREDAWRKRRLRQSGGRRSILQGGSHHRLHCRRLIHLPHWNPLPQSHGRGTGLREVNRAAVLGEEDEEDKAAIWGICGSKKHNGYSAPPRRGL